jgi:hypothetical protein
LFFYNLLRCEYSYYWVVILNTIASNYCGKKINNKGKLKLRINLKNFLIILNLFIEIICSISIVTIERFLWYNNFIRIDLTKNDEKERKSEQS